MKTGSVTSPIGEIGTHLVCCKCRSVRYDVSRSRRGFNNDCLLAPLKKGPLLLRSIDKYEAPRSHPF